MKKQDALLGVCFCITQKSHMSLRWTYIFFLFNISPELREQYPNTVIRTDACPQANNCDQSVKWRDIAPLYDWAKTSILDACLVFVFFIHNLHLV